MGARRYTAGGALVDPAPADPSPLAASRIWPSRAGMGWKRIFPPHAAPRPRHFHSRLTRSNVVSPGGCRPGIRWITPGVMGDDRVGAATGCEGARSRMPPQGTRTRGKIQAGEAARNFLVRAHVARWRARSSKTGIIAGMTTREQAKQ
jgi:hypothetical protein